MDMTSISDNENSNVLVVHKKFQKTLSYRGSNSKSIYPRLIDKTGRSHLFLKQLPNKEVSYFKDLGNTLLSLRWRWIISILCLVHFATFLLFGLFWMLTAKISGDFNENREGLGKLCVVNTKTFTGYFLLSIETITTIGFGTIYPTEECDHGWLLFVSEALASIAIQGTVVSIVYVKIARPYTIDFEAIFSQKAVICLRDGKLCLIVRIYDIFEKINICSSISLFIVHKNIKQNDNVCDFSLIPLKIQPYGFLIFPTEIIHIVNEESPLYDFDAAKILLSRFEIIAVAEGVSTITGQLSQNRTSYSNSDVLWGHRFMSCVEFNDQRMRYVVDCKKFNKTYPYNTPLCSARELSRIENTYRCNKDKIK